MEPININSGKSAGATNEFIHGMATLRINPVPSQAPATAMHPSPGVNVVVDVAAHPARDYPQPDSAWVAKGFTQSSPTRPSASHTSGTEAIIPGTSASSSPAGPKVNTRTYSFTLPLLSWPLETRPARRRKTRPRPRPEPFPGHYKPHRVRHSHHSKSQAAVARALLSHYERHPPTTQQERNRYNTLLALATGDIDKHHPHQPLFDEHFHHRVSMKREINNHRKEQLRRDRLSMLAKTKVKFEAIQRHKALVESSVEAFGELSLTGAGARPQRSSGAGDGVTYATGGKGAQVATQEEESLEDLDVDEYLYLDEDTSMDRMEE